MQEAAVIDVGRVGTLLDARGVDGKTDEEMGYIQQAR